MEGVMIQILTEGVMIQILTEEQIQIQTVVVVILLI